MPGTLGATIRALRKDRGWSQQVAAERVGVQQLAYGEWERNKQNPSDKNLLKLAQVFGVDARDLGYEPPIWTPETPPQWAVDYQEQLLARLEALEALCREGAPAVRALEQKLTNHLRKV